MSTVRAEYLDPFDGPATYRIVVTGTLSSSLSDRLEGMVIERTIADDGKVMTVLVGELIDQAALAGVLKSLYNLHRVIVTVEQFSPSKPKNLSILSDQEG